VDFSGDGKLGEEVDYEGKCSVIEFGLDWTEFTSDKASVTMGMLRALAGECGVRSSMFEGEVKLIPDISRWFKYRYMRVVDVTG
jgi:hypothetical protein